MSVWPAEPAAAAARHRRSNASYGLPGDDGDGASRCEARAASARGGDSSDAGHGVRDRHGAVGGNGPGRAQHHGDRGRRGQSAPSGTAGDQARAYALGLLAKLRLPDGARQAPWPAEPRRLPQPVLPYWPTYGVTVQALYRTGASMGSVYWFLTRHVPAGMQPRWPGNVGNGTDRYVLDVPAHLPRGIAHANLEVVVSPRGSG